MPKIKTTQPPKGERMYLRISDAQKRLVSQAAQCQHMTASQFVIKASLDAAQEVLADQTVFVLTPEQWDAFITRLDEPSRTIPALQMLHAEMTKPHD